VDAASSEVIDDLLSCKVAHGETRQVTRPEHAIAPIRVTQVVLPALG
jgi:hypothetical protein